MFKLKTKVKAPYFCDTRSLLQTTVRHQTTMIAAMMVQQKKPRDTDWYNSKKINKLVQSFYGKRSWPRPTINIIK